MRGIRPACIGSTPPGRCLKQGAHADWCVLLRLLLHSCPSARRPYSPPSFALPCLSSKDKFLSFGPPLQLRQCLLMVCVATHLGVKSEARGLDDEVVDQLVRARASVRDAVSEGC